MALDHATTVFLQQMAEAGGKPLHEMEPPGARQRGERLTELIGPGPQMHTVADEYLEGDGGKFRIRILKPGATAKGVIVYFHDGGWVTGNIDGFDTLGRQLAARTGCTVVLVDYRKAPENPYPTAVEDAWLATAWADQNREKLAGAEVPLILAGDSAGGNLAAVLAQRAKARSGPRIALQLLAYPVTDANFDTASYLAPENQTMLTRETMIWLWDHYIPVERRGETDASPLVAAGVPVRSKLFEGQMHGFFSVVNILPGAKDGMDFAVDGIAEVTE
ncbi:acetyl esterase [Amycolatopsis bartoniae]|uniref:Alpha/beta hydrolase fold-3 domain-containing protein n=1 Tax=Amycolatopsis bartoniae TaxID=941986 RepID=A0A8H9M377_9PSEU|nr:alpha/beta hydrolase [Amycolatopsis bartoniae]MBB2939692.1 acetyl esterase [Amycolatopsis bartoniae]TVT06187.1 alpha/beta hydrolase [Amycolatopsis bartoniae]GHF36453.1 hypothetical protein GCM10017566_06950 [Amycolatopsis bartoniae]